MRCDSALIRLDELRTGELDPLEAQAVHRHLEHCPSCSDANRQLDAIANQAPSLQAPCPVSCLEQLECRLFDRWSRTSAGDIDLWVAFSERGLTGIVPASDQGFESFLWKHAERTGKELRPAELPERLAQQVHDAACGHGDAHPAVDLAWLPPFERDVLQALLEIPGGEMRSYAWVAREVGRPKAVRAVGNACAKNPVPLVVPCHRVSPASGGIGGYAYGSELKRTMLEREGADLELVGEMARRGAKYVGVDDWYCYPTCHSLRKEDPARFTPVRNEREAAARGLTPCDECRPLEARP